MTWGRVGSRLLPDLWWQTFVGRGPMAFSACMGECASTHSFYAVECLREATGRMRRALLLPFEERAEGPQGADSVWAQHPNRHSENMCLDRSAHDG